MRSATEIRKCIIDFASKDTRVRAVLLNGSRANPDIIPDRFQDFDITYLVTKIESFINDPDWTRIFGEKLIGQLPDQDTWNRDNGSTRFTYLLLFNDGNRIDLTLFPIDKFETSFIADSLTRVWLDKDKLFQNFPVSNDRDYHIKKPLEKEYLDTCNEFWWVSTYVAKALCRNEIIPAKELFETIVRPMFMKLLSWKIGMENNFSIAGGKGGKFLRNYLSTDLYTKILATYTDADSENNWKSLFNIMELFEAFSFEVSRKLNFIQNTVEQHNTVVYIRDLYKNR